MFANSSGSGFARVRPSACCCPLREGLIHAMPATPQSGLFASSLSVINIGLPGFAHELASAGTPVIQVDWAPPAGGDGELAGLLARTWGDPVIEAANRQAVQRILAGEPMLIDIVPAAEAIPALRDDKTILHAGPPIEWTR